jgi:hypothetical protein
LDLFIFLNGFSTQFPKIISKASTLCRAKTFSQEDSMLIDLVLQGVKASSFLDLRGYNLTIYAVGFFEINSVHFFCCNLTQEPIVWIP